MSVLLCLHIAGLVQNDRVCKSLFPKFNQIKNEIFASDIPSQKRIYDKIAANYYSFPQINDVIQSSNDFELYIALQKWFNLSQISVVNKRIERKNKSKPILF